MLPITFNASIYNFIGTSLTDIDYGIYALIKLEVLTVSDSNKPIDTADT